MEMTAVCEPMEVADFLGIFDGSRDSACHMSKAEIMRCQGWSQYENVLQLLKFESSGIEASRADSCSSTFDNIWPWTG